MNKRLLKFKYKPGEILVKYEQSNNSTGVNDTITLESGEEPTGELLQALQQMADHAVEICELPLSMKSGLTVRSITCTYTNDVQGLVITTLRELDNSKSPMVINTPHFTREPYSETDEDEMNLFSFECADDLDTLEKLVFSYINGERAQGQLDFGVQQEPEVLNFSR